MNETFRCDDKETLVAYLYGEIDIDGRREVERHLRACVACAREAEGLHAVRQDLESWLPPEPELGFTIVQKSAQTPAPVLTSSRWAALGTMPAWAQVAAAVLVLAASAAIANPRVHYGSEGVVVTTGWMAPALVTPQAAPPTIVPADEWRPALVALEQNLRNELLQMKRTAAPVAVARGSEASADTTAVLRRVQAMLEASEQRQREEMALRLTQTTRDWNMQRQGDLMRISQDLGTLQGRAFKNEAGQREVVNYVNLLRRASSQPIP